MKIVSYFGNIFINHFKRDCDEIKRHGFSHIILCVPEAYMRWNLENVKAMKDYAESQGLKVWCDPWSIAGMFGGEALTTVDYKTDYDGAIRLFCEWLHSMQSIGFTDIFIDEPKCELHLNRYKDDFKFHVCLTDDKFDKLSDKQLIQMSEQFETIGLSCYFWNYNVDIVYERLERWISRLRHVAPNNSCVWIQGFNLPEGTEWIPPIVYDFATSYSIPHIAFWGYRSAEATSSIRAVNYKEVWNIMGELLNGNK